MKKLKKKRKNFSFSKKVIQRSNKTKKLIGKGRRKKSAGIKIIVYKTFDDRKRASEKKTHKKRNKSKPKSKKRSKPQTKD